MKNVLDAKLMLNNQSFPSLIEFDETVLITFVNPFSYYMFADSDLLADVNYVFSDGALLCWLHNYYYDDKIKRFSFDYSSIANDIFTGAQENDLRVVIVGATATEIDNAVKNIKKNYQNLNVVYSRDGYLVDDEEKKQCAVKISSFCPDLVIIGMGAPHQEIFGSILKSECIKSGLKTTIFTCGGFLTQTSIKDDYYLPIVKKLGLRWLQRAIMHSHVRKRIIKDYPIFFVKIYKRT
uniref:Glycosyl transferase WecB/TagA/CpsF n=1 Tax=Shewanella sp. (strain MR-7) TaxID=60481 RepID=Q0HWW1_SHESR